MRGFFFGLKCLWFYVVFLYLKCILSQMVNFHWKCLLGISFIPWCLHKKKWIPDWNYGTFLQYGQLVGGLFLNSSGIEMGDTLGWTFCTMKIPVLKALANYFPLPALSLAFPDLFLFYLPFSSHAGTLPVSFGTLGPLLTCLVLVGN